MGNSDDHDVPGPDQQADLEYDLAHEWTASPDVTTPQEQAVYVATETDDQNGDYGYDMAHGVPGR